MSLFPKTNKVLNLYGQNVVNSARRNLKIYGFGGQKSNRRKQNTGHLAKSLGYQINPTNTGLVIEFTSTAPYAAIVEEGRKKGSQPPSSSLIPWIKRKPVRLRKVITNSSGQRINTFVRNTPSNLRGAAYTMARAIKKRGIPPIPYFGEAMNDEFEKLPTPLGEALIEDAEDIIFDQLTKRGFDVKKI